MSPFVNPRATALFFMATLAALSSQCCSAFNPSQLQSVSPARSSTCVSPPRSSTSLQAGLFGKSDFLDGLLGKKEEGPKTVLDLPASDVKVGALRFLLNIHLVGICNKPEPNSWFTREMEYGILNIYYQDGTGMLSLELTEDSIKAIRYGEKPSLLYVLQESILLHSILDEISEVAFDVEAEQKKRLLNFPDDSVVQTARDLLPARKE
jgi:hypothetical protein